MTKHLYIHIPFCNQICSFCDFKRIKSNNYEIMKNYVDKIIYQVKLSSFSNQYKTIYLGGGTPNNLPDDLLNLLLNKLVQYLDKNYEFTIECNPDLITESQAKIFTQNQVNRISLGVQSTNNNILRQMKRTHTIEQAENAIKILQNNGISNISCDFIYDLPNTTNQDILDEIEFLKKHNISHASFYALEIKENSILNKKNYQLDVINQEDKMTYLHKLLKDNNFIRYEISNFAVNENYYSQHNMAYWLTNDWKAIGYGACGFENNHYYEVGGSIENFYITKCNKLDEAELNFQIIMMGLRLINGLNLEIKKYEKAFSYFNKYKEEFIIKNNHLTIDNIDLLDDVLIKLF